MIKRLWPNFLDGMPAVGLLLLRVVSGVALMIHGWGKIQNPFGWMDKPNAPSAIPDILQALAALGEFAGGAGLVVGLLTPFAALGVIATMLGAYFVVHKGDPWINPGGSSFELASVYFLIAATLLFTGPGKLSLDALLFSKNKNRFGRH